MEQENYFIEKKYNKFTKNIKFSLNKAINMGNMELAYNIKQYLDTIEKLKNLNKLKKANDVKVYSEDIRMYEENLEILQKNIMYIQFNTPIQFNNDKLVLDIPKFQNTDLNYIFMFIYKFLQLNSKSLCIILQNFIDDLFNLDLSNSSELNKKKIKNIENIYTVQNIDNISVVYNTKSQKVQYIYNSSNSKILDIFLEKINNYNLNDFFKKTENTQSTDLNNLLDPELNVIDDSNNIIYSEVETDYLIDNTNKIEFNKQTQKEFKITLAILLLNLLKNINNNLKLDINIGKEYFKQKTNIVKIIQDETNKEFDNKTPKLHILRWKNMTKDEKQRYMDTYNKKMNNYWDELSEAKKLAYTKEKYKILGKPYDKLSKTKLKNIICDYLTLNFKYDINKEYDLLYNYFLSRTVDSSINPLNTKKTTGNLNLIIPNSSLSILNTSFVLIYLFIKNNKNDLCDNFYKLLEQIKNTLVKQTYTSFDNGTYYYKDNKILSLCSNNPNAHKLINTFYLKYKEYDKVLISNLLLKIIENDSLKIKYDMIKDTFSVVIINQDTLNIDFNTIDKTKLLEGLNNDLKCINEDLNKNLIIKLINIIRENLNKVINIITDIKLLTSIFNLSTNSNLVYTYLKDKKTNFKIRKLLVIILIRFLITHISKFYLDPNSSEFNMYDTLINDLHKHICEKMTIEFSFNIYQKIEEIYKEFPSYSI